MKMIFAAIACFAISAGSSAQELELGEYLELLATPGNSHWECHCFCDHGDVRSMFMELPGKCDDKSTGSECQFTEDGETFRGTLKSCRSTAVADEEG